MQVWCPFLIVKGLDFDEEEDEAESKDLIKDHFEDISQAKIESIELKGTEAKISFINPQGIATSMMFLLLDKGYISCSCYELSVKY